MNERVGVQGKEALEECFKYSRHKSYIRTYDNRTIELNKEQIDEIIENALVIIVTGVDLSCDIWAIQWKNNYQPITL